MAPGSKRSSPGGQSPASPHEGKRTTPPGTLDLRRTPRTHVGGTGGIGTAPSTAEANAEIGVEPPDVLCKGAFSGDICTDLGTLPPATFITERALAELLSRSVKSIKRAVARGELPPPVRLMGASRWTAGAIVRHVEKRLEDAAREAQREKQRFVENSP